SPQRKVILNDVFSAPILAATPPGALYLLYMRDDALVASEFDERAGETRGTPRVIVDNIGRVANPAYMPTVGVSPTGALAYQRGGDFTSGTLYWVTRTGERINQGGLSGVSPSISPDGRWVAAGRTNGRGENELWVTDLTRGVSSRLVPNSSVVRSAI